MMTIGDARGEAEVVAAVEGDAAAGDPRAMFILANWRLFGMYGRRDAAEAHDLLAQAGEAGSIEAQRLRASLTASGTGCDPDPDAALAMLRTLARDDGVAARQVALLDEMPKPEAARRLPASILSRDPPIWLVRTFLSAAECAYLIEAAEPSLNLSYVADPATGTQILNPVRTSSGMNFDPALEDPVINAVNRRIAAVTQTDVRCGELLNILRYEPGQEYRPHLDALPATSNQRDWTVLVYLNDGYEGGETEFDRLAVQVRGRAGGAVLFRNVTPDGAPDQRTRHAGRPVVNGVKWLASRWIRHDPYDPWSET